MRRQLTEAGGGVLFLLLQLSESVFQLTKHVESYQNSKTQIFNLPNHRIYDMILRVSQT